MATNRLEGFGANKPNEPSEPAAADLKQLKGAVGGGGGGLKPWLPLIVALTVMPLLAYATTAFLLVPKLKSAGPARSGDAHGGAIESASVKPEAAKVKVTASLSKILVNVAGSIGTRYLLTSLTLVGSREDFKDVVENNRDQLLDAASGILSAKTIADLEKAGARNLIRNELIVLFNNILGNGVVKEVYITEFAIQ